MDNLTKQEVQKLIDENVFLNNKKGWNQANGEWRANAVMWRTISFVMAFVTLVAVIGMIWAAQLPDVVPLVYREDASGGLTLVGIPNKALKPDNGAIANQLQSYIRSVREVPLSQELRKRNVHSVKMMSSQQIFNNVIAPMMRDEYANVGEQGEQLIDIRSAMPIDKNIWQIDWQEYLNGKPTGHYKANIDFTLTKGSFKNPEDRMYNPFGIVVKDINVSQVIGG